MRDAIKNLDAAIMTLQCARQLAEGPGVWISEKQADAAVYAMHEATVELQAARRNRSASYRPQRARRFFKVAGAMALFAAIVWGLLLLPAFIPDSRQEPVAIIQQGTK